MKTILVIRLSSLGDVLLTLPVCLGVLESNPGLTILFLTRKQFTVYFEGIPGLVPLGFEPHHHHSGFHGLFRLWLDLRKHSVERVIDLHGVIRSYILDLLFLLSFKPVSRVRKYRRLRHRILCGDRSVKLPHATERYADTFRRAGLQVKIKTEPCFHFGGSKPRTVCRIGIAPLARHSTKIWNLNYLEQIIAEFTANRGYEVHLFGSAEEREKLEPLAVAGVTNQASVLDPLGEWELIASMDVFISMDSANMHLASLAGIPTISLWGSTDPAFGFFPLHQPCDLSLSANPDEVECRPCSVYGKAPCRRRTEKMLCMDRLYPELVLTKTEEILSAIRNK